MQMVWAADAPYMVVPVYGVASLPLDEAPYPTAAVRQYSPARQLYAPELTPECPDGFEEATTPKYLDVFPGARMVLPLTPSSPASSRERSQERKERRDRARDRRQRDLYKVFVGGLAPGTTSQDLMDHFARYGARDAQVCADPQTRRSRGFGYVELAGRPPPGLLGDHILDGRRCGVREYDYPGRRRGR